jgi:4,5:9,10-diseco-3-hydroxy-5,9,17-trioxoandrosta-1(10),2-diene-4-oate hydrolase
MQKDCIRLIISSYSPLETQVLMEDKYIKVMGYLIRYVEKGRGDPIVLIHGIGGSVEWWKYNMDALAETNRVIAFDFLGFGLSEKPKIGFSLELGTEFICSFLDALNIPRATLIGNSMGGLIALYTLFNYPERVDRLILVDNAGFGWKLSMLLRLGSTFLLEKSLYR